MHWLEDHLYYLTSLQQADEQLLSLFHSQSYLHTKCVTFQDPSSSRYLHRTSIDYTNMFTTHATQHSKGGIVFSSVCLWLSVCQLDNAWSFRDIITKFSGHHPMVEREPKFENTGVSGCWFNCPFAIIITRVPLAGRSELVCSTCKSCHMYSGWAGGSIYTVSQKKHATKLLFISSPNIDRF